VRGESEGGTGASGEAQAGPGRAAQVAAKEEEQQEDPGVSFSAAAMPTPIPRGQRGARARQSAVTRAMSSALIWPKVKVERTGSSSTAAGSAQGRSRRTRAPAAPGVLAAKHHRLAATQAMVTAVSSQFAVL
jgi:hypothetical protein